MTSAVVLDDHLLTLHLAQRSAWLPHDAQVATTVSWWFRLARALERGSAGALGRLVATLAHTDQRTFAGVVRTLPASISLPSPRDTVPQAAALSARFGLNLLAADALAVALRLDARILVSSQDDGPQLRQAAGALDVSYEAVELSDP